MSQPGFGTGNCRFEVLSEAAVAIEPSEGSFDHPPAGKDLKPGRLARPPDDLDRPPTEIGEGIVKFRAGIGGVGEQMAQPREVA
jgi:hypothetical protein